MRTFFLRIIIHFFAISTALLLLRFFVWYNDRDQIDNEIKEFYMEPILKNASEGMPRTDYPRPSFVRSEWYSLNGEWEFEFDFSVSGEERRLFDGGSLDKRITVPFCPESRLSGIGFTDFIPAVWYRKKINIEKQEKKRGCSAGEHPLSMKGEIT